jgi:hypothetical protein
LLLISIFRNIYLEGHALRYKDEYLAYASAKRQLQDMMKPQALTG